MRGVEKRRRIVIPGDEEALADETVRELNRRFALGDLSWFEESRDEPRRPRPTLLLADWSERWLEQLEGQVTAHTFKDYRSHVRDLVRRLGERRMHRITPGDVLILRDACVREGLRDRTIRNRLGVLELRSKRVTFRPLEAAELQRLAGVLEVPQNDGWAKALERPRVAPREGDAQKALRRTYITSPLVCGRNPKLVAGARRAGWWSRSTTRSSTRRTGRTPSNSGAWPACTGGPTWHPFSTPRCGSRRDAKARRGNPASGLEDLARPA